MKIVSNIEKEERQLNMTGPGSVVIFNEQFCLVCDALDSKQNYAPFLANLKNGKIVRPLGKTMIEVVEAELRIGK